MASSVYNFEYTLANVAIETSGNALNYSTNSINETFAYALPLGVDAGNVSSVPAVMYAVADFTSLISDSGPPGPIYDAIVAYFEGEIVKGRVLAAYNNTSVPQFTVVTYDFTTLFSAFIAQVRYKIRTSPVKVAPGDVFMFTFTFALGTTSPFAYKYAYYFKIAT
jgi:hypothetical protein